MAVIKTRLKELVSQVRKLQLRNFGLTISVDTTDRFTPASFDALFAAAYNTQWFKMLLPIKGLQSMRLIFDVNPQYTNPGPTLVTGLWPSGLPAIMSLAQELKDHWLSGKRSYENAQLRHCSPENAAGATGQQLEFVSWV